VQIAHPTSDAGAPQMFEKNAGAMWEKEVEAPERAT
jgi:hypothetical protein